MKNLFIFIFFIVIFFPIVNSFPQEKYLVPAIPLKMDVYKNNVLTETKVSVSFFFYQDQSKNWLGYWQYTIFIPLDKDESVLADLCLYTIAEGKITNFTKINASTYHFDMQIAPHGGRQTTKAIIKKMPNHKWQSELKFLLIQKT